MRLSQGNASSIDTTPSDDFKLGNKKDIKSSAACGAFDKLKASNFPASLLKIGRWEVIVIFFILLYVNCVSSLPSKRIVSGGSMCLDTKVI